MGPKATTFGKVRSSDPDKATGTATENRFADRGVGTGMGGWTSVSEGEGGATARNASAFAVNRNVGTGVSRPGQDDPVAGWDVVIVAPQIGEVMASPGAGAEEDTSMGTGTRRLLRIAAISSSEKERDSSLGFTPEEKWSAAGCPGDAPSVDRRRFPHGATTSSIPAGTIGEANPEPKVFAPVLGCGIAIASSAPIFIAHGECRNDSLVFLGGSFYPLAISATQALCR